MVITRKNFRIIVALSLLTGVFAIIIGVFSLESLPPKLEAYVQDIDSDVELSVINIIVALFTIMSLITNVALFFFAKWAPNIFVFSYFGSIVGSYNYGPFVYTPIEAILYTLSTVFVGMLIGLIYFSGAKEYFNN